MMTQQSQQKGAALIVSLLLLTTLTLIGLTSARSTRLQTVMAANTKESSIAFEAAEAAVRDAEQLIEGVVSVAAFNGNSGLLGEDDTEPDYFDANTWIAGNTQGYSGTFPTVEVQPRYIIKYIGTVTNEAAKRTAINPDSYDPVGAAQKISMFRITTRGTGRNDSSRVLIQTYYGKIF